jgi:hypothetical protein
MEVSMAFGYLGRWGDLLLELKVGESTFFRFTTKEQRHTVQTRVSDTGKKAKRKFSTKTIGDQVKVTRVA